RDRNAGPAVDDFVQVAVARVVVVVGVPGEPQLVEQELVERHDALFHAGMLGQLRAQPRGEPLDLAEVAFDVEPGIGVLRDEQARPGEIDVRLVAADELLELGHTAPRRWKSRTRKPSAARQARYANAPAATSPAIAGSLR